MIFLTEKEKMTLTKAKVRTYAVTYQFGKETRIVSVEGKACGVIPLADEVSVFAVYDEAGIENFVCDFESFISVVEKSSCKSSRSKSKSLSPLRIVQP